MAATPVTGAPSGALDLADMQGLVARAFGNLPYGRYLLCRIGDPAAARAWMGQVAGEVFTADRPQDDGPCLNVALTWEGHRRLGLPEDALATFPRALQEGMVTPHRSRILGDIGDSDPSDWRWGGPRPGPGGDGIHVLVMLWALTEDALAAEHDRRREAWRSTGALEEVAEPIEGRLMGGREHFGFADGLSQPLVKGWPSRTGSVHPPAPPPPARFADVEPGEILLGYRDNFGKPAEGPTVADDARASSLQRAEWDTSRRDLGRNGSFLVFRQLAQDVPAFRRSLEEASRASATRGPPLPVEHLGAKMVGRWASGASIVLHPESDPGQAGSNDFGYYDDDQRGLRCCPVGAHVRRSNPRDSTDENPDAALRTTMNHRILRRGRPYGRPIVDPPTHPDESEGAERGLLFICLNTDVERQFEFAQHTWLNNPFFAGLSGETDPLVGWQPPGGGGFTIPDLPVRRMVAGVPTTVTTKGGAYFFLPGVRALAYLGAMAG